MRGLAFPPRRSRCVEIGRLFGNPAHKPYNFRVNGQFFAFAAATRQFGIGKHAFDRAATDRVYRHRGPPTPAFGNGVIAIDLLTQRAQAQPARFGRRRFGLVIDIEVVFSPVMSGH